MLALVEHGPRARLAGCMSILDNELHGTSANLDRLGKLCDTPRRRRFLGLLGESDASYRERLRPALCAWFNRSVAVVKATP